MPFSIPPLLKPISNLWSQASRSSKSAQFQGLCAVAVVATGVGLGILYQSSKRRLAGPAVLPPIAEPAVLPPIAGPAALPVPITDAIAIGSQDLLRLKAERAPYTMINQYLNGLVEIYSQDGDIDQNQVLATLARSLKNQCEPHGEYPEHFANDLIRNFADVASQKGWSLALFSGKDEQCNDRDVMLSALNVYGGALEFASASLKNDADFMMQAVQKDPFSIIFSSARLQGEGGFFRAAIAANPLVLPYTPRVCRADPEAVSIAVAQRGCLLQHASEELRSNRNVVQLAVGQDPKALQFASADLQADPEILQSAFAE